MQQEGNFGKLDVGATIFGGGAYIFPSSFWKPGTISASNGAFGLAASTIPFTGSCVIAPTPLAPLSLSSIGINNHVGVYNVTGAHIKIGTSLSLGALDSAVTAVSNKLSAFFAKITPKVMETTPASSNNAAKGLLNGFWSLNGTPVETIAHGHSDIRLKKNIKRLDDLECLNKIMQLNPVSFDWREEKIPSIFLNDHRDENDVLKREIGFIAQEMDKYVPEVTGTKIFYDKPYKSIKYDKLTALLVGAVQEQQKEIKLLKSRIEILEGS